MSHLGLLIRLSYLSCFVILCQCSSNQSGSRQNENAELLLDSIYEDKKSDSLVIDIKFNAPKKIIEICATNSSKKEITLSPYHDKNTSYNPAPGFVLYVFEEAENNFYQMTSTIDYQSGLIEDSLNVKKFFIAEQNCENTIAPASFFELKKEKKYKFFIRYYRYIDTENQNDFVESNIIEVTWL